MKSCNTSIMRRYISVCGRRLLVRNLLVGAIVAGVFLWFSTAWLFPSDSGRAHETLGKIGALGNQPQEAKLPMMGHRVSPNQQILYDLAENLHVQFEVVENTEFGNNVAVIRLTNRGRSTIDVKELKWSLYFQHMLKTLKVTRYTKNRPLVEHIEGTLNSLLFPEGFRLTSHTTDTITIMSGKTCISKMDIFPNWYVAADGYDPVVIANTEGESLDFVGSFDTRLKYKIHQAEIYEPVTVLHRHDRNNRFYARDNEKLQLNIVPSPQQMVVNPGEIVIDPSKWVIVSSDDALQSEIKYLAEKLSLDVSNSQPEHNFISVALWDGKTYGKVDPKAPESYFLDVDALTSCVSIIGKTTTGVFWAIQSLLSLMDKDSKVVEAKIRDQPRFGHRGFMLDVVRNFQPKEEVLKLIDVMSMYKLNKLHLHLSDDEAWRLEIPGLPELTELGSKRCHDLSETKCLLPQLGSHPRLPDQGSGFYTIKDYLEILHFAKRRHIEVIPEFDFPSHARAAIKAMELRYSKKDVPESMRDFRLNDPEDTSQFETPQFFNDGVINPCLESTYRFIRLLVEQVIDIHKKVAPLSRFNIGGDEVPRGVWQNSPACAALRKREPTVQTAEHIKSYFISRVADILAKHKLSLAGWEDAYLSKELELLNIKEGDTSPKYANAWKIIYRWGTASVPYKLANAGYKVIMSHATHLYLDQPNENHPDDRGNSWASREISTFKTFSFMPDMSYENQQHDGNGRVIQPEEIDSCISSGKCTRLVNAENIVGMETCVWTETMRTGQQLEEMVFPRLLAVAERAWHKAEWEEVTNRNLREPMVIQDWRRFSHVLVTREFPRLDKMKVAYYLPPPGAVVDGGRVRMTTMFPGMRIIYSSNNGTSWRIYNRLDPPIFKTYQLATESMDGTRRSRIVVFDADKVV